MIVFAEPLSVYRSVFFVSAHRFGRVLWPSSTCRWNFRVMLTVAPHEVLRRAGEAEQGGRGGERDAEHLRSLTRARGAVAGLPQARCGEPRIPAQAREVAELKRLRAEIGAGGDEMGATHEDMGVDTFEGAASVDQAFLDAMITHHEDGVAMARNELETGQASKLKELAERIVDAQTAEIERMRELAAPQ